MACMSWAGRTLSAILAVAIPLAAGAAAPRQVGADLQLEPKRLVLSEARATGEVTISAPAGGAFDVSFIDRVMGPDGALVTAQDAVAATPALRAAAAAHRSARPLLAADAARVVLAPGETRTLTVRLTGTAPSAGEYRTHLTVTARAPEAARGSEPGAAPAPPTVLWAQSIPVFVRNGPVDVQAGIAATHLQRGRGAEPAVLSFDLVRQGESSLFGDVTVSAGGQTVAVLRGVGVYREIDRRRIRIEAPGRLVGREDLEIVFTDRDSRPGQVLASARVPHGASSQLQAATPGRRPAA